MLGLGAGQVSYGQSLAGRESGGAVGREGGGGEGDTPSATTHIPCCLVTGRSGQHAHTHTCAYVYCTHTIIRLLLLPHTAAHTHCIAVVLPVCSKKERQHVMGEIQMLRQLKREFVVIQGGSSIWRTAWCLAVSAPTQCPTTAGQQQQEEVLVAVV